MQRDYPREWPRLAALGLFELLFHLLAVTEAWLILSVIGGRAPTPLDAFVFEAANRFVNVVFKFVAAAVRRRRGRRGECSPTCSRSARRRA